MFCSVLRDCPVTVAEGLGADETESYQQQIKGWRQYMQGAIIHRYGAYLVRRQEVRQHLYVLGAKI